VKSTPTEMETCRYTDTGTGTGPGHRTVGCWLLQGWNTGNALDTIPLPHSQL